MGYEFWNAFCCIHSLPLPKRVRHRAQFCARLSNSHIFLTLIAFSCCSHCVPFLSLSLSLSSNFHSIACLRRYFLHKVWPIQLAFLLCIVCRILLLSLTLCNTFSFFPWSGKLIFSILLQHHISKLSNISDQLSEVSKFQHCTALYSKCNTLLRHWNFYLSRRVRLILKPRKFPYT